MWFAMLADVAVKGTLVLSAAWMAALLLRARSAAARHLVWTAAAAALLTLPLLTISLPDLPVRGAGAILPDVLFRTTATARAATPGAPGSPRTIGGVPSQVNWPLWLAILWIAGAGVMSARMLMACAAISRLRHATAPSPHREVAAELAAELGIRHTVDTLETAVGSMPMTGGILRPAVFLPADAGAWSDELRRAVLLHELAHVRRGDVATQAIARLALTLHWWNPLAWTAWRQFLKERERAADDMVLGAGARASDYAGHLLQMARSRQSSPTLAWAAVAMARRSQLEGRLAAILDARTSRAASGRKGAAIAALAAIALVAPLAAVRPEQTISLAATPIAIEPVPIIAAAVPPITGPEISNRGVAYGLGLLKIADLERSRNAAEAEAFYSKAAAVLGDRAEAAPAWMYLGIHKKNPPEALECLRKAERLDPAQRGPARMWMALMYEQMKQPRQAEELYKSALAVERKDSADAESTLQLYARFLYKEGRNGEADALVKQAAAARRAVSRDNMAKIVAQAPGVFKVGNGVKAPTLLKKVEPEYSEDARSARYQGTVVIYAEIGTDGMAHNLRVIKGLGLGLDEKALQAIDRWRFGPGSKDGTPVPVAATIEVNFRLL